MGAISLGSTKVNKVLDNRRVVECDITFSSSYATGGDTVSIAALGLSRVDDVHVLAGVRADGTAVPAAQLTGVQVLLGGTPLAPKLVLYSGSAAEVANASNNSTKTVRVWFIGK